MAAELLVAVPGTMLPSPLELMAAVAEAGFDIQTSLDDLPTRMDAVELWSAPCVYRAGQASFRIFVEKTPSGLSITLRHRTKAEHAVASILAATLARLVKRTVIVDPQMRETLRTARAAMAWARRRDADSADHPLSRRPRPAAKPSRAKAKARRHASATPSS